MTREGRALCPRAGGRHAVARRRFRLLVLTFSALLISASPAKAISPDPGLGLTPAERAWLEANKDGIRYGPNPNWPPGDYMEDGIHKGVVADYVKIFEQKLDIKFKRALYTEWEPFYKGILTGEFDFVGAVQETEVRKKTLVFTQPFLKTRLGIVTRTDYPPMESLDRLNAMSLTAISGYSSYDFVKKNYPGATYVESADDLTGLLKVSAGAAEGAVIDYMAASYLIQKYGITNLKFAAELNFHWDLRFGIHKQKAPLAAILDKVLKTISIEEMERIYSRWVVNIDQDPSFLERHSRLIFLGIFIFITLASLVTVIIYNRSLRRQVTARTHDLVTAHHRLEEQVKARTRELQNTKEEAERASEARSEFLAAMSHELRTPLNAILGYSQMLTMGVFGELQPKQKETTDNIVDGGVHLLRLVDDVLDLARIESNQL